MSRVVILGAACVASAGAHLRTGTAASMTVYPMIRIIHRSRT